MSLFERIIFIYTLPMHNVLSVILHKIWPASYMIQPTYNQ